MVVSAFSHCDLFRESKHKKKLLLTEYLLCEEGTLIISSL